MQTIEKIFETLLRFKSDKGGINAENGFAFQYACLLSDMLVNFREDKDFIVCGEMIDDYIFIDETGIKICQCKNYKSKSYNTTSLLQKDKRTQKCIWEKMVNIYSSVVELLNNEYQVNSWLLINRDNNISFVVESEKKKAYCTDGYCDFLALNLISEDEKLNLTKFIDKYNLYRFAIKKSHLGYDTFDSQVAQELYNAISEKYSDEAKYSPIVLFRTLINKIRERAKMKNPTNLQQFSQDIETLLSFKLDRFAPFSDVKDLIQTQHQYDFLKVNESYLNLYKLINPQKDNLTQYKDFCTIKEMVYNRKSFDEIIESCEKQNLLYICTSIEEIIALILLCKGERA